jgi:hypothetical protein
MWNHAIWKMKGVRVVTLSDSLFNMPRMVVTKVTLGFVGPAIMGECGGSENLGG